MNLQGIEQEVRARLSPRRMRHTLGCTETAARLARRWGAPQPAARMAGLLHDVTKELSIEDQLNLCKKHGIILNNVQKQVPSLLHALTGAKVAEAEFGAPPEVCSAIRWHTTGREDMALLEKIIWLSDLIEPSRKPFPGLDEIRNQAERDLNAALLSGMDRTIEYLLAKRQMIDTAMLQARNWLLDHDETAE